MNETEETMLSRCKEILGLGADESNMNLWCQYDQYDGDEGRFSWVLFFWYLGEKHQISESSWTRLVKRVGEITSVDLATRELLLSL